MSGAYGTHRWIATAAPLAGRYDDVLFLTAELGWAVSGNSEVLRTENGARTWEKAPLPVRTVPRCIGMVDDKVGWIGCITREPRLFETKDGGRTWKRVADLPKETPPGICGLQVIDPEHVVATGTNFPERDTGFLKSVDGGQTWQARRMEDHASILVDIYFKSPTTGWIVGARKTRPNPRRSDVVPIVLKTEDGGNSWKDTLPASENPPLGEWGWKIQFVDEDFAVIANENFRAGAILVSEDGGNSWRRQEILDADGEMVNANLEGVGFLDRNTGWVGGWGDEAIFSGRTSGTVDGGRTWCDLTKTWPAPLPGLRYPCPPNETRGQYINRFRFIDGVGYASGNTVYKYTNETVWECDETPSDEPKIFDTNRALVYAEHARFPLAVPKGAKSLTVEVFDRFAGKVRTLIQEQNPSDGPRDLDWDLRNDKGEDLPPGQFMLQVDCDGVIESRLVYRDRQHECRISGADTPYLLRED
ncbi:MAG: YCF48-related protein [Alphaproteobacteria bacterium]|nr:YCF48-related protein [Alphaproteobacteria bacterium]